MLVDVGDTRLHVEERGGGDPALIVLQGGPGLDHTMFGRWLDPLGERVRLLLVDERGHGRSDRAPPETWTLAQHAHDVDALATVLGLERYVVLGHSFGASIALQRAVDVSGRPSGTIVSSGIPAERFLAHVEQQLQVFEPVELRALVTASWAREPEARTPEDVASIIHDQLPFHVADPRDSRIEEVRATGGRRGPRRQLEAETAAAASSAASSCARTSVRPLLQNSGSVRSRPAICPSSSGLREPPALSSSM